MPTDVGGWRSTFDQIQYVGVVPVSPAEAARARRGKVAFVAGLDLGQSQDFTALAVLEVKGEALDLRHLHRWDLGTAYPRIVTELRELLDRPELRRDVALVVDGTGVGRPVIDYMEREGLAPIPVSITGGDTVNHEGGWYRVPKRDLVSSLAVGFESGSLRVAAGMVYADVLRKELDTFRAKISLNGSDTYEAWRERDHDDLVLAAALATWWANRDSSSIRWLNHYTQMAERLEREAANPAGQFLGETLSHWTRI
jgi:hypothetical protein